MKDHAHEERQRFLIEVFAQDEGEQCREVEREADKWTFRICLAIVFVLLYGGWL